MTVEDIRMKVTCRPETPTMDFQLKLLVDRYIS